MTESPAGPYAATLTAENDRLAALLAEADPSTDVPTCPGWDLSQLLKHVGRGHRWAAQMVASRATEVLSPRDVVGGRPPDGGLDVATEWLRDSARELVDAVTATGADAPVWTFTGPKPAAWWVRRRLHEATVHRGDAAIAAGRDLEMAPDVAADGLSEWLDLLVSRPVEDHPPLEPGVTLHLHATDDELGAAGEWLIRPGDGNAAGRVTWEHGHGKGDAAVRGTAVDLLMGTLRRIPADDARLEVLGDAAVWRTWLERTGF